MGAMPSEGRGSFRTASRSDSSTDVGTTNLAR